MFIISESREVNKLLLQWCGPYEVDTHFSKTDYGVHIDNCVKVFHINRLKHCPVKQTCMLTIHLL